MNIEFVPTAFGDVEQLAKWIQHDPYHKDCLNPEWWLTGNGLLSFRVDDLIGPVMYIRTEPDDGLLRIHTQFAPEQEVSKLRVVRAIVKGLPKLEILARDNVLSGFVYRSVSPLLVEFMIKKFRFVAVGKDDYRMLFEG